MRFAAKTLLTCLLTQARMAQTMTTPQATAEMLARIRVSPVENGAIVGEQIDVGSLWAEGPVMIQVVRRPG